MALGRTWEGLRDVLPPRRRQQRLDSLALCWISADLAVLLVARPYLKFGLPWSQLAATHCTGLPMVPGKVERASSSTAVMALRP